MSADKISRRSRQRETIRRVLMETDSHPGADWVYQQVRREIPNISIGTVYRNLRLLASAGEIQQVDTIGGTSRFDGNTKSHYHFRCERCGGIYDLDEAVDRSVEEKVAKKTGFAVTGHRLEFFGLCSACRENQARGKTDRIRRKEKDNGRKEGRRELPVLHLR